MARSYSQHCALAHALDVVGERWTLLIVRELLAGPRRYSDLAAGLVTVPTNLLASRLKEMEGNGLVRRRRLPAPADSVFVYELTDAGQALGASVLELARWGMRTLPAAADGRPFRAHWLVLALRARFDPTAAAGIDESYEFRIDGDDVVHFHVASGEARMGPATDPAVRIAADADTLAALTGGAISGPDAIVRGARIDGDAEAIERMRAVLPLRRVEEEPVPAAVSR
jgi:DNA-binding HxlR family transcriptional regulator